MKTPVSNRLVALAAAVIVNCTMMGVLGVLFSGRIGEQRPIQAVAQALADHMAA